MNEVNLKILGMHCASCVHRVEGALQKFEGVKSASVHLIEGKARVEVDPNLPPMGDRLVQAVKQLGYSVSLVDESFADPENEGGSLQRKLAVCIFLTLPNLVLSMGDFSFWGRDWFIFILTTPVFFWGGAQFYQGAWAALRNKTTDMNTLITLGTFSAYFYSVGILIFGKNVSQHALYFEAAAVIITLILLGRFLEERAKGKTRGSIRSLLKFQQKFARLWHEEEEREVSIADLKVGDLILVKPGERIPVDGIIIEGSSTIDESMVTGEPIAKVKRYGDEVMSGTLNITGVFKFEAKKVGKDTLLQQIIRITENAQMEKAPVQRLADRISGIFVPIVLVIAVLTLVAWVLWGSDFPFALTAFVSVLIIACPCALGLATPTAIMVGTGRGAQSGILVKSGETLEQLQKVNVIVFDKTGTLTKGYPEVTKVISLGKSENEILRLAATIETNSEHPLALAIVNKAKEKGLHPGRCTQFEMEIGLGARGIVEGKEIHLGSEKYLERLKIPISKQSQLNEGENTLIYVAVNKKLVGVLAVADRFKAEAKEVIQNLQKKGLEIVMMTGDHEKTAQFMANQLGISTVYAGLFPQEKLGKIKEIQKMGKRVAMVGDGINDAPGLAAADIGIALGAGTDVAIEASDVTLVGGDLRLVEKSLTLSRKTIRIIRQNLFFAFIYNTLGIPIAAGILYPAFHVLLNPMVAALAMSLSSVSVVTNSLRLRNIRL